MNTSATDLVNLRRSVIQERVVRRIAETHPERIKRVDEELQRLIRAERPAIEARLRHRDTEKFMSEEMESELGRITEQLKAAECGCEARPMARCWERG